MPQTERAARAAELERLRREAFEDGERLRQRLELADRRRAIEREGRELAERLQAHAEPRPAIVQRAAASPYPSNLIALRDAWLAAGAPRSGPLWNALQRMGAEMYRLLRKSR